MFVSMDTNIKAEHTLRNERVRMLDENEAVGPAKPLSLLFFHVLIF